MFCNVKSWASSLILHFSNSLSMNEYLALDSVGYLCVNSVSAFTAAWLNASQSIRDDVQLNMSVAE